MLTRYGGLDISEAMEQVVRARDFPVEAAWKIAESVSGRDGAVQFSLFCQLALDTVADAARRAAISGELAQAATLSELWREVERMSSETQIYNLDKRQHVMGLLRRMWQA